MRSAVAAAALTLVLAVAPPASSVPPGPLDDARRAAEQTPFEGIMEVRWADGAAMRSEKITVKAADGTLAVLGGNQVMAFEPFERLVSRRGDRWEELWRPTMGPSARPDGTGKYQVTTSPDGPLVAGRPTTTVEVRQAGVLRERVHLDTATKLALRREQYDDLGAVSRALAFESLTLGPPAVPAHPRTAHDRAPRPVSVRRMESALAPDRLAGEYLRVAVYRSGDVVQVLYSDGIYDLSVFEQSGRLRHGDLPPSGERVRVGGEAGRRYVWAGGHLVVWSSGGTVFTAVSDAPLDQVLQAVRSMAPAPEREPSLIAKLRRACQTLMEPLS